VVDNFEDKRRLEDLAKRQGLPVGRVCVVSFSTPKYDISRGKCVGRFRTVLDHVLVDNDTIFNLLVDLRSAERIVVIPLDEEARRVMSDERHLPKNCVYAVTHRGFEYYPFPNYRSYGMDERVLDAKLLCTSVENRRRQVEADVKMAERCLNDVKTSMNQLEAEKRTLEREKARDEKAASAICTDIKAVNVK